MKLEDQVVSLALAKRLKELGVKQESVFQWAAYETQDGRLLDDHYHVVAKGFRKHDDCRDDYIAAFTVAELGEMIDKVSFHTYRNAALVQLQAPFGGEWEAPTEADARAKMLIHLIEQGLVKP